MIFLPVFSGRYKEFGGRGQIVCRTAYTTREAAEEASEDFKKRCLEVREGQFATYEESDAKVQLLEIELDQCES